MPTSPTSQPWHPSRTGVLLIHGLTGSPTEMGPLEKALRRAGYRTAVPLIAGHGAGHEELLATTWHDWRDGLRQARDELLRTCDDVVVVGLCVGGLLGALLAVDEKRVRGVVCLSPDLGVRVPGPAMPRTRVLLPVAYHVPWLRRHGYWTQRPPYGLKNPRLQRRIARALAASVQGQTKEFGTFRTYVGTLRELKWLQQEVRRNLSRVRCPVLLIHSMEDSMFSIRNTTVLYQALGSLDKEIALITGCDHVITVDLRKDDVARRVLRFLAAPHEEAAGAQASDDDFLSCEISPEPTTQAHRVVVRKGTAVRLTLQVRDGAEARTTRIPSMRGRPSPCGDGQLQAEWQLAREAIDALAFGCKTRLIVEEEPAGKMGTASVRETSQPATPAMPHRSNANPPRIVCQDFSIRC